MSELKSDIHKIFDDWFKQQQPIPTSNEYLKTDVVQIYKEALRAFQAGCNTRTDLKAELVEAIESTAGKRVPNILTDACERCYLNGIHDAIAAINTIMGDTDAH